MKFFNIKHRGEKIPIKFYETEEDYLMEKNEIIRIGKELSEIAKQNGSTTEEVAKTFDVENELKHYKKEYDKIVTSYIKVSLENYDLREENKMLFKKIKELNPYSILNERLNRRNNGK